MAWIVAVGWQHVFVFGLYNAPPTDIEGYIEETMVGIWTGIHGDLTTRKRYPH